jgi:hypothetical protein
MNHRIGRRYFFFSAAAGGVLGTMVIASSGNPAVAAGATGSDAPPAGQSHGDGILNSLSDLVRPDSMISTSNDDYDDLSWPMMIFPARPWTT